MVSSVATRARDTPPSISGMFKVGVHIADVSYFVKEHTPLDIEAAQRTTSVYLVDRVGGDDE